MSYLLSQGVHHCDVAIVYPVADLEGGFNENDSVKVAFDTATNLYKNGIDLDFIDFESVNNAKIEDKQLIIAGETYKILIIPSMKTVRYDMLKKALEFKRAGGIVICIGEMPKFSDHFDVTDTPLSKIVNELFIVNGMLFNKEDHIVEIVRKFIKTDFYTDYKESDVYINHRIIGERDIFMVYGVPKGTKCFFKAFGEISLWNPYEGLSYSINHCGVTQEGTFIETPLDAKDFQFIVFDRTGAKADLGIDNLICGAITETIELDNEWDFELKPSMDNRFGDFFLPESNEIIGAQLRRFHYCESDSESLPDKKEYQKNSVYSFGAYLLQTGPFKDENQYTGAIKLALKGEISEFKEYEFSMRFGLEKDPGLQGYHGLKGKITDDFLTIGKMEQTMTGSNYVEDENGFGRVFYTNVYSEKVDAAVILTGELKPDILYVNGIEIADYELPVELKAGNNSVVAGYRNAGRTHLIFAKNTDNGKSYPLSMKWYTKKDVFPFNCYGDTAKKYSYYYFMSPPALQEMEIFSKAKAKVWINGNEAKMSENSAEKLLFIAENISPYSVEVIIQLENRIGEYGAAAFINPIHLTCGKGKIKSGDWSEIDGLRNYSGGAVYSSNINITEKQVNQRLILSLDEVVSTVSLFINDVFVETKVAPKWEFDINKFVKVGENTIRFEVYNTLSNHYDTIPTRYNGSLKSGILGKCKLYVR